jgi:hypothetical protein
MIGHNKGSVLFVSWGIEFDPSFIMVHASSSERGYNILAKTSWLIHTKIFALHFTCSQNLNLRFRLVQIRILSICLGSRERNWNSMTLHCVFKVIFNVSAPQLFSYNPYNRSVPRRLIFLPSRSSQNQYISNHPCNGRSESVQVIGFI